MLSDKCTCNDFAYFCFKMPTVDVVEEYFEPMVKGTIICPDQYLGNVTSLCLVCCFFLTKDSSILTDFQDPSGFIDFSLFM